MRFLAKVALCGFFVLSSAHIWAGSDTEELRKEIDDLRKQLYANDAQQTTINSVDALTDCQACRDGDHNVTTRSGKLEIGGLLQIWEHSIHNDRRDVFSNVGNSVRNNDSYRIRRSELKFTMQMNDCISAVIMVDPAREATSFAPAPSNQGLFKSTPANTAIINGTPIANTIVGQVQTGAGTANKLLQDAYINFHDLIPHHDITVGQFKPPAGEEGLRSNANLDFCERAMVTQLNELRDLGIQLHGSWWDDCDTKIGRLQYWVGAFDGAGNFFNTAGDFQNRADDNSSKDVAGKLMIRPLWTDCIWGRLELGVWGQYGKHGGSGDLSVDGTAPVNGLNRLETDAHRVGAWFMYKPMGCLRGLWSRGEYGEVRDRTVPSSVDAFGLGSGPNGEQAAPNPFKRRGWYGSVGYKLTDSIFADRLSKGGFFNNLLQPVELAFRYERFGNIIVEDPAYPDARTKVYDTNVMTAGVNYYVWAYKHRIQLNYMRVRENISRTLNPAFRHTGNDAAILSYQIAF